MSINIIKQTSTANTTSAPGRQIKYIVIHYTAGTSSKPGNARANASWFGNPSAQASADFVVDDAEIVQVNPDPRNRYCWAVGGGKYNTKGGRLYGVAKNSNCISIEICSNNSAGKITYPNDPKYYFTDASVNNAVLLTQYLMKEYNIDANHVIRHYDVNGKQCPGIIGWNADTGSEQKWVEFKQRVGGTYEEPKWYRVRKSWADAASQLGAYKELQNAKDNCPFNYAVFDNDGKEVFRPAAPSIGTMTAKDLNGMSEAAKIAMVAPIYQEVMRQTGMLASVGLAQFCLESYYGTTDLAQKGNNMHGMKCSLSGNTWANSVWDGKSKNGKYSPEEYNGVIHNVYSEFRAYPSIYKSVQDRAAYFIGAWLDAAKTKHRYPNINKYRDAVEQAKALKAGGYATDSNYVPKLTNLINRFNLTQYDKGIESPVWSGAEPTYNMPPNPSPTPSPAPVPPSPAPTPIPVPTPTPDPSTGKQTWYRAQVGAYQRMDTRDNRIAQIKQIAGYDCFYEKTDGLYYVYCGSFKEKDQAQNRVNELGSKGINAFVKEAKV